MKLLKKGLTWFLTLILLVSSIPAKGMAEEIQAQQNQSGEAIEEAPFVTEELPTGEILQQRTENAKIFYNGDGTFTKQIYFEPIHKKQRIGKKFPQI